MRSDTAERLDQTKNIHFFGSVASLPLQGLTTLANCPNRGPKQRIARSPRAGVTSLPFLTYILDLTQFSPLPITTNNK
jgi:hypothetical protein